MWSPEGWIALVGLASGCVGHAQVGLGAAVGESLPDEPLEVSALGQLPGSQPLAQGGEDSPLTHVRHLRDGVGVRQARRRVSVIHGIFSSWASPMAAWMSLMR